MISYAPARPKPPQTMILGKPKMGSLADMTLSDWGLFVGSAVVGGAGINGLVSDFKSPRVNAIGVGINLILTGVGATLFIQKGMKAFA